MKKNRDKITSYNPKICLHAWIGGGEICPPPPLENSNNILRCIVYM